VYTNVKHSFLFSSEGDEPVVHKTFHSYTVRAKQGGSQSSRDNRGNYPKSAGASLRRYNEQMLLQVCFLHFLKIYFSNALPCILEHETFC